MSSKTSVVVLCCDGLFQRSLLERIANQFTLSGVVRHVMPKPKGSLLSRAWRHRNPIRLLRYFQRRKLMRSYEEQSRPMIEGLFFAEGEPPAIPAGVPIIDVSDVNEDRAVDFIKRIKPDVICVNGTNLLRQPMLGVIPSVRLGAINLHTGLSPYSRGGNCNLYMLLEGHPELVGLTVHHISPGVDSGDIIFSARPTLEPQDTYEIIDAKTFRLGIDLVLTAIRQLQDGRAQRVPQWEKGKLFLRKTGYVYNPSQRVRVNQILAEGLISRYLREKDNFDSGVRLVG